MRNKIREGHFIFEGDMGGGGGEGGKFQQRFATPLRSRPRMPLAARSNDTRRIQNS